MHRLAALVMVGLSLAVVLAVGSVAWHGTTITSAVPTTEAADPADGYAFYAALDRVLAGEDSAELKNAVTSDFIDHSADQTGDRSLDQLIEQVGAYGSTFPGSKIEISQMHASGGSLVAEVSVVAPGPGRVAGITFSAGRPKGGFEVLRVRRGKVSERWALPLPPVAAMTFEAASVEDASDATLYARLFRVDLSEGGRFSWSARDVTLVIVESGSASLTVTSATDVDTLTRKTKPLPAGSVTAIPDGASLRLESDEGGNARLLVFGARQESSAPREPFHLRGAARSTLLWESGDPIEAAGPWRAQIGGLRWPGGASIELGSTSNAAVVLVSQSNPLDVAVHGGTMEGLDERNETAPLDSPATLAPGGAVELSHVESATLTSSTGDEVVWVITFSPTVIRPADTGSPAAGNPQPADGESPTAGNHQPAPRKSHDFT